MTSRRWLLVVSIGIHVALVAVFVINGLWHIVRLDPGRTPASTIAVMQPLAAAGGSAPAATPSHKPPPKVPRPITHAHVQPPAVPPVVPPVAEIVTDPGLGSGTGSGSGSNAGSGSGSGSGTDPLGLCAAPPCGVPIPVVTPPIVVVTPLIVDPRALAALRISGETQVHPSDLVKTEMARDGVDRVVGRFKICISEAGAITLARLIASTRYPDYDARLTAAVLVWQYRPYTVAGHGVPICGVVTFVYTIHD